MEVFHTDYSTFEAKVLAYMETNEDLLTRTQIYINLLENTLAKYKTKYYEAAGFPVRKYVKPC